MSQPVVDTLRLCGLLRKTGMEREQAEGMARVLGEELGEHVAVQGDVQSVFRQVRSDLCAEIQQVRSDLGAEIQKVRSDLGGEIQQVRHDLGTEIQQVRGEVQQVRHDLGARIQAVDGKIEGVKAELGGRIDAVGTKLDALNNSLRIVAAAIGLTIAIVGFVAGTAVLRSPAPAQWYAPPQATVPAAPAPAGAARTSMP